MQLSRRQLLSYGGIGLAAASLPSIALAKSPSDLQIRVNELVQRQRRQGLISRNERTAWSVYDFNTKTKLVSINENSTMQAASMVKVFVALAYFYLNKQAPSKYPYHTKERRLMELMLVKSSNYATNQLMKMCRGPANVARLCKVATGNRYPQLRIVEYIPAGGRTYRNRASASDYSRFLYDLWYNKLPHSAEIKRIMSIRNRDRIQMNRMPSQIKVYDKTGSTGMLCGDMGIIQLGNSRQAYTFIGIIQKSRKTRRYRTWIRARSKAMRQVSGLVYDYMDSRYRILSDFG